MRNATLVSQPLSAAKTVRTAHTIPYAIELRGQHLADGQVRVNPLNHKKAGPAIPRKSRGEKSNDYVSNFHFLPPSESSESDDFGNNGTTDTEDFGFTGTYTEIEPRELKPIRKTINLPGATSDYTSDADAQDEYVETASIGSDDAQPSTTNTALARDVVDNYMTAEAAGVKRESQTSELEKIKYEEFVKT